MSLVKWFPFIQTTKEQGLQYNSLDLGKSNLENESFLSNSHYHSLKLTNNSSYHYINYSINMTTTGFTICGWVYSNDVFSTEFPFVTFTEVMESKQEILGNTQAPSEYDNDDDIILGACTKNDCIFDDVCTVDYDPSTNSYYILITKDVIYIMQSNNNKPINSIAVGSFQTYNNWAHFAFVFRRRNKDLEIEVYINGHLENSCICRDFFEKGVFQIAIGGSKSIGLINDFRIYSNAILPKDIERIFNAKLIDMVSSSVSGGVVYDNSGFLINKRFNPINVSHSANSLYFNGTSSEVRTIENDGLYISGGTLSIWFTPIAPPTGTGAASLRVVYIDPKSRMVLSFFNASDGTKCFAITTNSIGSSSDEEYNESLSYLISTSKINYGTLNNITILYQDLKPVSYFINGEWIGHLAGKYRVYENDIHGMTIGRRRYNATSFFNGYINEVKIYKNVLTQEYVEELYEIDKNKIVKGIV